MGITLTAIVPATDRPPTLERCVEAISAAAKPPEQLVVVSEPGGSSPAAARNLGAARATGDVLVFIDSDVVVDPDAFARIRRHFATDPELTAVFGSYDDAPEARDVVSVFRNLLHHVVHQQSPGMATTFWAGLGAIRRPDFIAANGFDARRFKRPSVEDVELGMRLASHGARIELDPALVGKHLKAWSPVEMIRTDLFDRGVPWVVTLLRARRYGRSLNLGWRHRLSALASVALLGALLRRRPVSAAGALSALVLLNRSLYALVWRRRGPTAAVASVGLHVVHHLTGVVAVPLGCLAYASDPRSNAGAESPCAGPRWRSATSAKRPSPISRPSSSRTPR